ncbi:MAG: hypothetical protein QXU28_05505 [Nitrososphaerota archaeon]
MSKEEYIGEHVIIRYGVFGVNPAKMVKWVKQQVMTDKLIYEIIKQRRDYLRWMHEIFAYKVLKPPVEAIRH